MTERLAPLVAIGPAARRARGADALWQERGLKPRSGPTALPSMQNPRPSTPHRLDLKGAAGLLQDPDKGPRRVALGGLGLRTFQRGPDKL